MVWQWLCKQAAFQRVSKVAFHKQHYWAVRRYIICKACTAIDPRRRKAKNKQQQRQATMHAMHATMWAIIGFEI